MSYVIILVLLLYVLPTFLAWRTTRWLYRNVYGSWNTDLEDVVFVLFPVINIATFITNQGEIDKHVERKHSKKFSNWFFGLNTKGETK